MELKQCCEAIETENKELNSRLSKLENKMLKNNLIIHGIQEDQWKQEVNRQEKIHKAIACTVDDKDSRKCMKIARSVSIVKTEHLGRYRSGSNRPISICFEKSCHAETLFQCRKHLSKGVFVNREYTEEPERARKLLRPILKLAKTKPEYKGKSRLDGDVLVIQGYRYSTGQLHKLPSDINGFKASSKENDGVIAFFGELNPLSNFHAAHFEVNGHMYQSSEQFIQEQKAIYFKDYETSSRIMNAATPLECKELAREIHGFDCKQWETVVKEKCKPGILAKFTSSSNTSLGHLLLTTGQKKIVKVCYDSLWGTGVPLKDKDCLKEHKWKNIGVQGEILMEVCDLLSEQLPHPMEQVVTSQDITYLQDLTHQAIGN